MGRAIACAGLVLLAVLSDSARGGSDDAKPPTKTYDSGDHLWTFAAPAAWAMERDAMGESFMTWIAQLPGGAGPVKMAFYSLPGMVNARQQASIEMPIHASRCHAAATAHIDADPVPRVSLDCAPEGGGLRRMVWMYRVVRRNGVSIRAECDAKLWPKVEADCLRVAQSLATTLEEWSPGPKGSRSVARDGYEYWLPASIRDGDLAGVHRMIRDVETEFAKVHGPLPKSPECPFVVVVNAKKEDAAAVCPEAAQTEHGACCDGAKRRLFVVMPTKPDAESAAELACEAWRAMLLQTYGGAVPYWLYVGEAEAMRAESLAGKLPSAPEGLVSAIRKLPHRLDDLTQLDRADADSVASMFAYVALFRCGPKPYKDAFNAFLKDTLAGGDCATAQKTHLLSLDQDKLRTAAATFVAKGFFVVKGK